MAIVTLDFETTYDKEYSLRKLSTIEYIMDGRFQTILCAIKLDDNPTEGFIGHDAVAAKLATIDWTKAALLAHNTAFDGAILAWRYGIVPAMYLDTLSMARAITHAVVGRSSLEAVSRYLGLPPKGTEVHNALGLRLENMTPEFLRSYMAYCVTDTENCRMIFDRFRAVLPVSELALIDTVIRMFTCPQVKLNPHVLAAHLGTIEAEAAACMARVAHIDKSVFSSNPQFAKLLEAHGVEVPLKLSPATGMEMPALAKNDRAFKELCADDEQPLEVQALLAARLQTKSTIEQTRTQKLLSLSLREWPGCGQGWAPVPLKYWGAKTGRLSGDGGYNWQNFRRGSRIREAIEAPPGFRIMHRDASQIEARIVAWLAGCRTLTDAFAAGRDVYSEFASIVYGETVTKDDKPRRFVGKTGILGLGYQCGAEKFRHMLFIGNGGVSIKMDIAEATKVVYTYRNTYPEIPDLWISGGALIQHLVSLSNPIQRGNRATYINEHKPFPVVTPGTDAVWLPNGTCIAYPNVRQRLGRHPTTSQIIENYGYDSPYGEWNWLYGGIMCFAANTTVLTPRGWIPIVAILSSDMLWDGVEWVRHDGCVFQGVRPTIEVSGVRLTPDHGVLTDRGWRRASQSEGYRRAACGLPYRGDVRWRGWEEVPMGCSMPVRRSKNTAGDGAAQVGHAQRDHVLWVYARNNNASAENNARDVEAPGVRGMALYVRQVLASYTPSLGQLRRTGHYGVRLVARVRAFLGGHGADISFRINTRKDNQLWRLWARQLRLGHVCSTSGEPQNQRLYNNPRRKDDGFRGGFKIRRETLDTGLAPQAWVGCPESVYDIINAGPRRRFTVRTSDGTPMIVHNCENVTQALARIVVTDIVARVTRNTGYQPFLSTHDSLDYCVPLEDAPAMDAELEYQFAMRPAWAPDLPLASEGGFGRNLAIAESERHEEHNL